jgi:hypothetical protein
METEEWPDGLICKEPPFHGKPAEFGKAVREIARATYRVRYKGRDEVMIGSLPGLCRITQHGLTDAVILASTDDVKGLDRMAPCSLFRVTLDQAGREEPEHIPSGASPVYVHLEAIYQQGVTGKVKAERVSDHESILTVWADTVSWPELKKSWDLLEWALRLSGLTDPIRQLATAFEITIQGGSPDGFVTLVREIAPRVVPEMTSFSVLVPTEHFPGHKISVSVPTGRMLRGEAQTWEFGVLSLGDMLWVKGSCHPEYVDRMAGLLSEIERVYKNRVQLLSGALTLGSASPSTEKEAGEPKRLAAPTRPAEPKQGSNLEEWFDYYSKCRKAGYKITLKGLADRSGFSYSYVRQRHSVHRRSKA